MHGIWNFRAAPFRWAIEVCWCRIAHLASFLFQNHQRKQRNRFTLSKLVTNEETKFVLKIKCGHVLITFRSATHLSTFYSQQNLQHLPLQYWWNEIQSLCHQYSSPIGADSLSSINGGGMLTTSSNERERSHHDILHDFSLLIGSCKRSSDLPCQCF